MKINSLFYLRKISKLTELDYDLLNMEAKTSMKSKYRRSNKNLQNGSNY